MAAFSNTRYEIFSRALARGRSQPDAYEEAGYERSSSNASVLARRPEIQERVAELLKEREELKGVSIGPTLEYEEAIKNVEDSGGQIDRVWIIKQLMENARLAQEAAQFAASNKALELLGKEIGMFQESAAEKEKDDEKKKVEQEKKKGAIPLAALNKALADLGFEGKIDLTTKGKAKVVMPDKAIAAPAS